MSRTDLDAATLAASLRRMAGDPYDSEGGIEWVHEPIQARVLLDVADLLEENAALREQMERLVTLLRVDCDIEASWDGLRKFWSIGLTEDGCLMRDRACKAEAENAKLRELVRDYERCSVHADCAGCEYDGKLSTHCPLGPCFPDIDELLELGPWKELPHGGVVTESFIRPSEEGSACPVPMASVTFEGQKFTFDAEDSKRFAKLLEGHLRKIAGVEVDE